jgi:hypothetical protein
LENDIVPKFCLFELFSQLFNHELVKLQNAVLIESLLMLHSQLHQRQQHAFNGFVAEEFFDRVSFFSQDHLHQVDQNVYYEGLKLLFFAVTAVSTSQVVSSPKHRTHYLHVGTEHIDQLFFVPDTGFNFFLLQLMRLVFLFEFLQFLDH